MDYVSIDKFVDYVKRDIVGAPITLMQRDIVDAAIELCERTKIWRFEIDPESVIANISEYEFDLPEYASLVEINSLSYLGSPLTQVRSDGLDRERPNWRDESGAPREYTFLSGRSEITLTRKPLVTALFALKGQLTVKPERGATRLPKFLLEDYIDAVSDGAKSRLFGVKGKDYTDPKRETACFVKFQGAIDKLIPQGQKGHARKARYKTKPSYF